MTQVRTGLTEKYEGIVAAGSEEAMRELASKLTVKELRGIWEKNTPYAEVQRTTGLSKLRKADWVDTVVSLASMEVAKKAAAAAQSAPAPEASCAESAEATETQTAPAVKEDTVPEQTASATEELTARNRFEVGQIYGKTARTISIDPNVPSDTYIDSAWLVLSRTKKYITVKNMDPYSYCRGEIKQFYVHSVSEEPYIPHEYFAQRKSSNARYQDRISSLNLMDAEYVLKEVADHIACEFRWAAERIYTHGEHAAVYEPEDWEETYSDYAGGNAQADEDIPACADPAESDTVAHETAPAPSSKSASKLDLAVDAVNAATTYLDVHAALMKNTKDMIRALKAVITGEPCDYPKSWDKGTLATYAATGILSWRKCTAYRESPYEERYDELFELSRGKLSECLRMMSLSELSETARRLGISRENRSILPLHEVLRNRIMDKFRVVNAAIEIESLARDERRNIPA